MRSQLPAHPLVTLLGQFFGTTRCHRAEICLQTSSRTSRSLHSSFQSRRCHVPPHIERPRRQFQTYRRSSADHGLLQAASVENDSREVYTFRARQENSTGRDRRQTQGMRIAVLGGGITGLSNAYYLTRELPGAKITLYEADDRVGGWVRSKLVNIGDGSIVFEQGPRTLRYTIPAGLVVSDIIQRLDLEGELLLTGRQSDAALNRFIYYPDHLVRMPGLGQDYYSMIWSLITEPIFKGLLTGVIQSVRSGRRPGDLHDESVTSFFRRRLGSPDMANNILSAVLHGIYAGDIDQLSMKSLFRHAWHLDGVHDGLFDVLSSRITTIEDRDARLYTDMEPKINDRLKDLMRRAAVYTFKRGIGTLSDALEKSLRTNPNVDFKLNHKVKGVEYDTELDGIKIRTHLNHPPAQYTNCVSTISAAALSTLTPLVPSLAGVHAVTVMVVNLYYSSPHVLPQPGFGYLIPRSIPFAQNPECALGVVFDSFSSIGQDTAPGTKVTVMLGGHWWDHFSEYPDEEQGAAMAKTLLHRHLGIDMEPETIQVGLQRDCIPQYVVGHDDRLKAAHGELLAAFKGNLSVAGSSYSGVGLNDCARAARDVAVQLTNRGRITGLESFERPRVWLKNR